MDKNECLKNLNSQMDRAINYLEEQLLIIRAGKASPAMLTGVTVDYYGTMTPIDQVASINTADARTIVIQPWEKKMIPLIEKAILSANLGFNPQNNGEVLRIPIPAMTEERRKELVKQARNEAENARIAIRSARRDANEILKKLQKDGLAEDECKAAEADVQKVTDQYGVKVDELLAAKEKEIMTV